MDLRRRWPLRRPRGDEDLRSCPRCASGLIQEVHAEPCGDGRWLVERRCPDCGWVGAVRCSARAWIALAEHQRRGRQELAALLAAVDAVPRRADGSRHRGRNAA